MSDVSPNPLIDLHRKAGARIAEHFGCELPAAFGDAAQEFNAARNAAALLDINFYASFEFSGPDRVRYLNAITTGDVKSLKDGQGAIGLLLNPQGHILAELETYALADRLLVLSHSSVMRRTAETLEKFIIMDDVTLADTSAQSGFLHVEGPAVPAILYEVCGAKLEAMAPYAHREVVLGAIPCRLIRRSHFAQPGATFLAESPALPALWKILLEAVRRKGGGAAGFEALNALRLEAGIPWFGYDFDDKVIPHEAGLETSHISYTKGCYTGQEIVERVRSRGHVNRRRVSLSLSGPEVPPAGAKLLADGKEVGHVTSAAKSFTAEGAIGMGYLRREHNSPGSKVKWEHGTAEVMQLPQE